MDPSLGPDALRRWARGRAVVAFQGYRGEIDVPRPDTLDMAAIDAMTLAHLAAYLKDPMNDDSLVSVSVGLQLRGDGHSGEARRRLYELALRIHELALPRAKGHRVPILREDIVRIRSRLGVKAQSPARRSANPDKQGVEASPWKRGVSGREPHVPFD